LALSVTSVTPAGGPTVGGTVVEILGADFRLPPDPPPDGIVPVPPPTVAVLFGDAPGVRVQVVSASRLFVAAPMHDPEVVDVTVENLDDDGVPIEEAVLPGAYTFARPKLTEESITARVSRALLQLLKRLVIENVSLAVHVDFDEDPTGGDIVKLAELPAILLSGPDTAENRFYSTNEPQQVDGPLAGMFAEMRQPRTVDLQFAVSGISDSNVEELNLQEAVEQALMRVKTLEMLRDPSDPALGSVSYELDVATGGAPRSTTAPNQSNLRSFTSRIIVRGVDLEGIAGIADDFVKIRGCQVEEEGATIAVERFEAPLYDTGPNPRERRR
jgi:hypothetical protein